MELINPEAEIKVPPELAVCPYCGSHLTATFDSWARDQDGSWLIDHVSLTCEHEPDVDDSDDYWEESPDHGHMPYVYWLPVCKKVEKWINSKYRFDLGEE